MPDVAAGRAADALEPADDAGEEEAAGEVDEGAEEDGDDDEGEGAGDDGVKLGLRSSLPADAPLSSAASSGDCAGGAVCVRPANQVRFPEVIVFRSPCSLPSSAVSAAAAFGLPDVSADDLPTVSAGSGTELSDPLPEALPALAAGSLAGLPLATARSSAPEREPPVPSGDDDMVPLSTTASADSPSGSASGPDGAVMSGACVVRPASSTPSSSVLTDAPLCRFLTLSESRPKFRRCYPPLSCLNRLIRYLDRRNCHQRTRPPPPRPTPLPRSSRARPRCLPARGSSAGRPSSAVLTASPRRPAS